MPTIFSANHDGPILYVPQCCAKPRGGGLARSVTRLRRYDHVTDRHMGVARKARAVFAAHVAILSSVVLLYLTTQSARSVQHELSPAVQFDEIPSAGKTHLERMRASRDAARWGEVIDILRLVQEQFGEHVIPLTEWRAVSVREYCQRQLASLPPEALELYRRRVDPQAHVWYENGVQLTDAELLRRVVRESFCSSWGDDALLALGEMALEAGRTDEARALWEQLVPDRARDGELPARLSYPETDLDLAAIRARLILVSILDGDADRASGELTAFHELHHQARGRFAGREIVYADYLERLLKESAGWGGRTQPTDWPTFAGAMGRNRVLADEFDVGAPAWAPILLGPAASAALTSPVNIAQSRRVGEERNALLSYQPLVVGNLLLVNNQDQVFAYDLRTGRPAWGESAVVYPGSGDPPPAARAAFSRGNTLGVPRFTLTVHGNKLFARLGSQVTSWVQDAPNNRPQGQLACLDLNSQGRLLWSITAGDDPWAFEGSPLADAERIYIGVRRSEVNPQAHVACYEAETGNLIWRRYICSAQTPARGIVEEQTHNLLTLAQGTLYYNTNLGCVAALDAADGRVQWLAKYPRAGVLDIGAASAHFFRDLNPCVYDRGSVYAAPSDCSRILALDAGTGRLIWQAPHVDDAVHLLGVGQGRLLASGDRLWWLDAENGKMIHVWPDKPAANQPSPRGFGRGLLAGDKVYWPTLHTIHVFKQRTGEAVDVIRLQRRLPEGGDAMGGNLVAAGGLLVIATPTELLGFTPYGQTKARIDGAAATD